MFGVVWFACVNGEQLRAFARMLGFNDFAFGLLGAIPFLASVGQLAAAITIERTGLRKYHFLLYATLHRLLWFAVAAVPLVLPPGPWAVATVLLLLTASHYLAAVSVPSWTTWMGDLIPRRIRGRYFARRTQWSQIMMIVAIITISIILDKVVARNRPETVADQPLLLLVICGVFAVGAVFGVIDILTFLRIRELIPPAPPVAPKEYPRVSLWARLAGGTREMLGLLLDPLKDKAFRSYVGYAATLTFSAVVGSWYYWRQATEGLGFSKLATNGLFLVLGPLGGTMTAGMWGRRQDRWGRRPVMIICTILATIAVIPWFFVSRNQTTPAPLVGTINAASSAITRLLGQGDWNWATVQTPVVPYLVVASTSILAGVGWMGIGLAQTGIILGFCDGPRRNQYVAASAVLVNMGGAAGGLLGGVIAQSLSYFHSHPIHMGQFVYTNWHATFFVGIVVRALSMAWLAGMPDPGAASVMDLLRNSFVGLNDGLPIRWTYPFRILLGARTKERRGKSSR